MICFERNDKVPHAFIFYWHNASKAYHNDSFLPKFWKNTDKMAPFEAICRKNLFLLKQTNLD